MGKLPVFITHPRCSEVSSLESNLNGTKGLLMFVILCIDYFFTLWPSAVNIMEHVATRFSGNLNVSSLPWVSAQPNAPNKLVDTKFYKLLCDGGSEEGKFRAKLFQFHNDIAPIFLPLR